MQSVIFRLFCFHQIALMAYVQNLDQIEEVPEGTFNWELDSFLEAENMMTSPSFRFGRSKSYLAIGCEARILDSTVCTVRAVILTMIVPDGFSVFSKVTSYNIWLIDASGQKIHATKGTLFHNEEVIYPVCFGQALLTQNFLPGDTATIRLSWQTLKTRSGHEEGTQTTHDLSSGDPRSTLLEKLSDDLRSLYDSKSSTDCVLKVGNMQFPVHRALLSARSTVFAAMFQHETSEKLGGVVDIPDVDVAVLSDVLKYMYSGKVVGLTPETASPMYELADKYAIFELRDHCLCFLKNNIAIENVCYAAVLAHTHGEAELEGKVSKFIEDRFENIQQTDRWKQFVNANPLLAVKYLTSSFIACKKSKKDDPN